MLMKRIANLKRALKCQTEIKEAEKKILLQEITDHAATKAELESLKKIKRADLWMQAWCAVATAVTCTEPGAASRWADIALQEYEMRFGRIED